MSYNALLELIALERQRSNLEASAHRRLVREAQSAGHSRSSSRAGARALKLGGWAVRSALAVLSLSFSAARQRFSALAGAAEVARQERVGSGQQDDHATGANHCTRAKGIADYAADAE